MAEEKKNEIVPVDADYEVVDQVDDQAIVELMTGQAIQDYVYSFNSGGRVVEGLTLAGINEAANRRGGIQVEEMNYEELEHSWIATVKAVDTITGSSRWGAYEQPKMNGGRVDPFAFTKAVHKAQRNAVKQLLPVPVIREVLNFYLQRKVQGRNAQQQLKSQPSADNITNAQKAAFAIAEKLSDQLDKNAITKADFWNYVKRRYSVESRNDMSEQQWTQLSAELKAAETAPNLFEELCKRIKQLATANDESEVPTVKEPDETETYDEPETEQTETDSTKF
ncbi:MAG: hypothetical protein OXD54_12420 [Candidatus Poribacteria bacterium]|nr:hypothetical protein [Candidatus Poribacteria bacterium]